MKHFDLQAERKNIKAIEKHIKRNLLISSISGLIFAPSFLISKQMPIITTEMTKLNVNNLVYGLALISGAVGLISLSNFFLRKRSLKEAKEVFIDHEKYNIMLDKQEIVDALPANKIERLSADRMRKINKAIHNLHVTTEEMDQIIDKIQADNNNEEANMYLKNIKQDLPKDVSGESLTEIDDEDHAVKGRAEEPAKHFIPLGGAAKRPSFR